MWTSILIVTLLVVLAGTFAGLTLALFGIRLTTLERKVKLGDQRAGQVYKLRKHGNLLLCSLLLGNVTCYTIIAIYLANITDGYFLGGFIATSLIFVFGEILPQAVFPKYALEIGARTSWLVWIIMVIFYPVAAPIAFILDYLLGKEPPVVWTKQELSEIIRSHAGSNDTTIDEDEGRIAMGALSFSDKRVSDIMIPVKNVFYIESGTLISAAVLKDIKSKGFSRIPVYDSVSRKISGILHTKDLIGIAVDNTTVIDSLCHTEPIIVHADTKLDNLLNLLVARKFHMALVTDTIGDFIGVATIEDIMEEILKTELEDIKS